MAFGYHRGIVGHVKYIIICNVRQQIVYVEPAREERVYAGLFLVFVCIL